MVVKFLKWWYSWDMYNIRLYIAGVMTIGLIFILKDTCWLFFVERLHYETNSLGYYGFLFALSINCSMMLFLIGYAIQDFFEHCDIFDLTPKWMKNLQLKVILEPKFARDSYAVKDRCLTKWYKDDERVIMITSVSYSDLKNRILKIIPSYVEKHVTQTAKFAYSVRYHGEKQNDPDYEKSVASGLIPDTYLALMMHKWTDDKTGLEREDTYPRTCIKEIEMEYTFYDLIMSDFKLEIMRHEKFEDDAFVKRIYECIERVKTDISVEYPEKVMW